MPFFHALSNLKFLLILIFGGSDVDYLLKKIFHKGISQAHDVRADDDFGKFEKCSASALISTRFEIFSIK